MTSIFMSQIEIILGQKNSTGSHQHTEFMAIPIFNAIAVHVLNLKSFIFLYKK